LYKDFIIDYAQNRACFRSGEIRILDSNGAVERVIRFKADRRLTRVFRIDENKGECVSFHRQKHKTRISTAAPFQLPCDRPANQNAQCATMSSKWFGERQALKLSSDVYGSYFKSGADSPGLCKCADSKPEIHHADRLHRVASRITFGFSYLVGTWLMKIRENLIGPLRAFCRGPDCRIKHLFQQAQALNCAALCADSRTD
jgi:hypothetical protein